MNTNTVGDILDDVVQELNSAMRAHSPMYSSMEGLAVLEEEVDELKYEIRHGTKERAREEAIQVAAMAIRLIKDTL